MTDIDFGVYRAFVARTFGENLKRKREAAGVTQEQLALTLGLKRSSQISLVEGRSALPKPETIIKYAEALKCQPYELLEEVETGYDRIRSSAPDQSRQGRRLKPGDGKARADADAETRALEAFRRKNAQVFAQIAEHASSIIALGATAEESADADDRAASRRATSRSRRR